MSGAVQVRTAFGGWRDAYAVTEVEPTHMNGKKVHDFPVIWVEFPGQTGRTPWPAEDVRDREYCATCECPADAHDAEGQCWFPDRSLGAPCVCDEGSEHG